MENSEQFFDFAAEVGFTKHIGGVEATEEMIQLCQIGADSYVLDVGCGAGVTPAFIARKYGCRVVGVDILEGMVQKSKERAEREGITDLVEFRVADAQDLPFEDDLFDAVFTESATAFPEDKQKAVDEYVRVLKPGGYVGLNESTWLKVPPPPEVVTWASQDLGATVKPLASEEWVGLLEGAGLEVVTEIVREISVRDESRGILQRYGCGGMLRIWRRTFSLYRRNPAYRAFVRSVRQRGLMPENLTEYFGFGVYVGRKAMPPNEFGV
jgi:ubiquinone/menaquinone biosynthesis C-methylase UbiE